MIGQAWFLDQKTMHVRDPHTPDYSIPKYEEDWLAKLMTSWYKERWAQREAHKNVHATFYLTPFITKYRTWKHDDKKHERVHLHEQVR